MTRTGIAVAAVMLAGCGDLRPALEAPTVTTLPNGTVEVTNNGPSGWADTSGWRLVELYRIGGAEAEGTGPGELVDPMGVALSPSGVLYVVDQKPGVIKEFGADGRYLRSFGREGGGPGEFQVAFIAAAPGVLVLHDPRAARTSVFDSTGQFLRSWSSSCCYWSSIFVSQDTVIHVQTGNVQRAPTAVKQRRYLRYRLDGTFLDTMAIYTGGATDLKVWQIAGGSGKDSWAMATDIPLVPSVSLALDPAGGAVVGWPDRYQFIASATGRDTTQIVTLAASPVAVSDARRTRIRDSMVSLYEKDYDPSTVREAFQLADIPGTAPFYESIQVDGRRNRWVHPDDGGNRAAARFDVFDSTGAYLGAVPVPTIFGSAWQTVWGTDRVATIAEDAEGLPVVVVYRIEKP
jgi:hypothetical protein